MLSHILTATYKAIVTLCLPFRVRVRLGLGLGLVPAGGLGRSPCRRRRRAGRWPPAGAVGRLGRGGRPCGC